MNKYKQIGENERFSTWKIIELSYVDTLVRCTNNFGIAIETIDKNHFNTWMIKFRDQDIDNWVGVVYFDKFYIPSINNASPSDVEEMLEKVYNLPDERVGYEEANQKEMSTNDEINKVADNEIIIPYSAKSNNNYVVSQLTDEKIVIEQFPAIEDNNCDFSPQKEMRNYQALITELNPDPNQASMWDKMFSEIEEKKLQLNPGKVVLGYNIFSSTKTQEKKFVPNWFRMDV